MPLAEGVDHLPAVLLLVDEGHLLPLAGVERLGAGLHDQDLSVDHVRPVSSSTSSTRPVSCFLPASPAGAGAVRYWSPPAACPPVLVAACPVVCPGATATAAPAP